MINLRKDTFPHVLHGMKKRTVHMRTVRFVLHVREKDNSSEEQLFRR